MSTPLSSKCDLPRRLLVQESGIPFRHQMVLQDELAKFSEFYLIACVVVMHITPLVPLIDKALSIQGNNGQLQSYPLFSQW